jgi:hypothetical protein
MKRFGFYGGLFLVTTATLMLQLIQTRIFSVVSWYHLAFFVISIAMFGLTAGAVWVYLQGERFSTATLSHDLAHFTGAFAVATVAALAVQLTVPPVTEPALVSVLIWALAAGDRHRADGGRGVLRAADPGRDDHRAGGRSARQSMTAIALISIRHRASVASRTT